MVSFQDQAAYTQKYLSALSLPGFFPEPLCVTIPYLKLEKLKRTLGRSLHPVAGAVILGIM